VKLPEDPFVLELLPEFVDTWISDIEIQFKPLLASRDNQELYRFGHTIKGSCLQFGLDEIATIGIELMGYAKEQNWNKAAEIEKKLVDAFKSVKKII